MVVLHGPEYVDQTPREVFGQLMNQGRYLCSVSTMYRLLRAAGQSRERRNQRPAQHHAVPRLQANAPDQVWTWDISKLATRRRGQFLNLYLILDLYSRYIVGWMVALRENSRLAQQLIQESVQRRNIQRDQLILHNDRGAPMTALGFVALLESLGIDPSLSRPRVSNDNPYSESAFKTLKYQPEFPGHFQDVHHARRFMRRFVTWYNDAHHHCGLNGYTPAEVYSGQYRQRQLEKQAVLDAAHAQNPQRWINGAPRAPLPPARVSINPSPPELPDTPPIDNESLPDEALQACLHPQQDPICT